MEGHPSIGNRSPNFFLLHLDNHYRSVIIVESNKIITIEEQSMSEGTGLLGGKAEPTYEQKLLKSCVAEFIGTFFLVATIALSAGE